MFRQKVGDGEKDFIIHTYANYFEAMQKQDLSWKQRELIMILWARYCGLSLSENISKL